MHQCVKTKSRNSLLPDDIIHIAQGTGSLSFIRVPIIYISEDDIQSGGQPSTPVAAGEQYLVLHWIQPAKRLPHHPEHKSHARTPPTQQEKNEWSSPVCRFYVCVCGDSNPNFAFNLIRNGCGIWIGCWSLKKGKEASKGVRQESAIVVDTESTESHVVISIRSPLLPKTWNPSYRQK